MSRLQPTLALLVVLIGSSMAWGQRAPQQPPHLGYLYPAGGQRGSEFELTLGGQYLDDASSVHVSGDGVQVTIGKHYKPLNQAQAALLRNKLDDARTKLGIEGQAIFNRDNLARAAKEAGITAEQLELMKDFRQQMQDPKRQPNPAIAETVTVHIKLAADATPGAREVRLISEWGLSNPLYFQIGTLPEFRETEPNDRTMSNRIRGTLPQVINGQIKPGDIDRFSFQAKAGTQLVASVSARDVIPNLADAVPGWFEATLTLYDNDGRELAFSSGFRFRPDPLLVFRVPADGTYTIEIHDALYRGREDFIYRIALGEVPFLAGIFPLGGREGTSADVELHGWNLDQPRTKIECAAAGVQLVVGRHGAVESNRLPFAVDTLPECLEREPNNAATQAQTVEMPIIVNGRIEKADDQDVFQFHGRAGEEIVAEVFARRLESPLDSLLVLTDATGKELARNDDYEDKAYGLTTHHADSRITFRLPADGNYLLHLTEAQQHGGPEYAYRLRVAAPQPDFELRVVPASLTVRPGMSGPVTVYALRKDGFAGEIALRLKNAPEGFVLSGGRLPENCEKLRLTLSVPAGEAQAPQPLELEGRALIGQRIVTHTALPAEDMMQAFIYHHLVAAKQWMVAVNGRGWFRIPRSELGERRLKLPAGGTAEVRFDLPSGPRMPTIDFTLVDPPPGIHLKSTSTGRDGLTIVVEAEADKVRPGEKGNLVVDASVEPPRPANVPANAPRFRVRLGSLPAIPFEIVGR